MKPPALVNARPACDCGKVHDRCAAHARTKGGAPCRMWPEEGSDVCRMHGGAAPQVKARAEQRRADAQAEQALARVLGDIDNPNAAPVTDPAHRLAALAGRLEHAVDEVGARVSQLNSLGIITAAGGQQLRAEVTLWERLLGHLRSTLDVLIKAGYMERQQAVAEQRANLLGQLVAAALDAAGATGTAREAGMDAARARLHLLDDTA